MEEFSNSGGEGDRSIAGGIIRIVAFANKDNLPLAPRWRALDGI